MQRYLTFKDATSDKFWKIETDGKSFKVTYGKTGSAGVTQIKEFASAEKCEVEANKLVTEKLKKGYTEGTSGTSVSASGSHIDVWNKLVASDDLPKALNAHLTSIAQSAEAKKWLKKLTSCATSASIDGDELVITFENEEGDEEDVNFSPPYKGTPSKNVPPSFLQISKLHNGISFESGGGGSIGFFGIDKKGNVEEEGGWEYECLEEGDNEDFLEKLEENDIKLKDVKAIIGSGQNWIIFDPVDNVKPDEPLCLYVSHENCEAEKIKGAEKLAFSDVLIGVLAMNITGADIFPGVSN